ncbi:hypothetical protein AALC25_15440 [Lachnospiraceae bacterium 29-84]
MLKERKIQDVRLEETPLEELKAQHQKNKAYAEEVIKLGKSQDNNWLSINLPNNCLNVCISFKREIAEMQIDKFGAKSLYGFEDKKEEWLPVEIFITHGGLLAPEQRLLET